MEDATKALLIAAGVLISLMIVSLGIALGQSLSEYTDDAQQQIEENALQSFNNQFTKYINCTNTNSEPEFTITVHDIITVANIAYENNVDYDLSEAKDSNYYVTVNMAGVYENLEKEISGKVTELLENYSNKTYRCTYNDVIINQNTGRVCKITFKEITK